MKALAIGDAFLPVAAAGIVFAIGSMPSFSTACILFSNISAIRALSLWRPLHGRSARLLGLLLQYFG